MKRVQWMVPVVAALFVIMVSCAKTPWQMVPEYDINKSDLLDGATPLFIGEPSTRDLPVAVKPSGDNVLMVMRSRSYENEDVSADYDHRVQLRAMDGTLMWSYPVESGWLCRDILVASAEQVWVLIGRWEGEVLQNTAVVQLDASNGNPVNRFAVPGWNLQYDLTQLFALPEDHVLVYGRRTVEADSTFEAFGVVVDSAGQYVEEWTCGTSMLLPLEDGFLGATARIERFDYPDLMKVDASGNTIWTIERADTVFGGQLNGVTPAGDGDLIVSFWDWMQYRGVVARIGGADGAVRWVKPFETGFFTHMYNPLPWKDGQFLVLGQKSYSSESVRVPFWESVCVAVFDGDGNDIEDDGRIDFWAMPVRGGFEIGENQLLFAGIGGADVNEMAEQWDVAWVVLDKP